MSNYRVVTQGLGTHTHSIQQNVVGDTLGLTAVQLCFKGELENIVKIGMDLVSSEKRAAVGLLGVTFHTFTIREEVSLDVFVMDLLRYHTKPVAPIGTTSMAVDTELMEKRHSGLAAYVREEYKDIPGVNVLTMAEYEELWRVYNRTLVRHQIMQDQQQQYLMQHGGNTGTPPDNALLGAYTSAFSNKLMGS